MRFRLFDRLARRNGYVPATEMAAAIEAKDKTEQALRHKTRDLEQQVMLRDRLESEVAFLRELQLAHARHDSGVCQAVSRIDAVTDNLLEMMKSVWPDAFALDPGSPRPV